jgi:hypothetical protein
VAQTIVGTINLNAGHSESPSPIVLNNSANTTKAASAFMYVADF